MMGSGSIGWEIRGLSLLSARAMLVALLTALTGCGAGSVSQAPQGFQDGSNAIPVSVGDGSSTPAELSSGDGSAPANDSISSVGMPDELTAIAKDPDSLNPVPEVVVTEMMAETGIRVSYTSEVQRLAIDPRYIELQWSAMQTCTGQIAPPPLVLITIDPVKPFLPSDDVIYAIDGSAVASAHEGFPATIQIRQTDFDATRTDSGFHLRSIFGRHLWLSAGLAERDYPFRCARLIG